MSQIDTKLEMATILAADNVAEYLSDEELSQIGADVVQGFTEDVSSRSDWETRTKVAHDRAMQVIQEKNYPWQGASNVKFPLITISALQYHARAYPATVPGFDVVGCRVIGPDPTGERQAKSDRVSAHMSFQRMEEDEQWEASHDKLLLVQAIVGSAFKKQWYDAARDIKVSELVLPQDLVVNYYAKSLDTAQRYTHKMECSKNCAIERIRNDEWLDWGDVDMVTPQPEMALGVLEAGRDQAHGVTPPPSNSDTTPYTILEQYLWLDLDGDGYAEPYVATVMMETQRVMCIRARFISEGIKYSKKGKVVKITPEKFFVHFPFIPSPDGGFYGMGFGMLLGGVSDAIDTLINLIIDQGHMAAVGGGFLGKGIRIRGGDYMFKPNEWKRTENTGDDLAKNIVPLKVPEPNATLYQALVLLIEYGVKIGMATDAQTGENPGQNTKAAVNDSVIAEGEKVFNGIYKRTYRSMKEEFRNLHRLNYIHKPEGGVYNYLGADQQAAVCYASDYFDTDKGIIPSADPFLTNDKQKYTRTLTVHTMALQQPGFDINETTRRTLKDLKVTDIDKIFPGVKSEKNPKGVEPPVKEKIQVEQIKADDHEKTRKQKYQEMYLELQEQMRVNDANIAKTLAEIELIQQQAGDTKRSDVMELLSQQVDSMKQYREHQVKMIEIAQQRTQDGGQSNPGGVPPMGAGPGNGGPQGGAAPGVQQPVSSVGQ